MAGRVILLNGAPSSGKTTLARALHEVLEPPHLYLSFDAFCRGYLPRHWDASRGPWSKADERVLFVRTLEGYLRSLQAMAETGHHVLTEAVILPKTLNLYLDAFAGLEVLLLGVRCPLAVAQRRERERAARDRNEGAPIELDVPEFELVHAVGPYDVEVDTSTMSVAECLAVLRHALDATPRAFARLVAARE